MDTKKLVIKEIKDFINKHSAFFEKYEKNEELQKTLRADVEADSLISQLSEKVFPIIFGDDLSKITFDLQGHIKDLDQKTLHDTSNKKLNIAHNRYSQEILKSTINRLVFNSVVTILLGKDETLVMLKLYKGTFYDPFFNTYDCPDCNESVYIDYDCVNKKFILAEHLSECPTFKHLHKFIFKVPSKKLVFLNKGYDLIEVKRKDQMKISINSSLGKIKECQAYAKMGMPYFALRDGCVDILHSVNEKIIALDIDEHKYITFDEETEESIPADGFKVEGSISLGVFAVYMIDYDLYTRLCKDKGYESTHFNPVVVDITSDKVKVQYNVDKMLITIKY